MADRRLEQLLAELDACRGMDPEGAHARADWALLAYIVDVSGDERVLAAFAAVEKWYA